MRTPSRAAVSYWITVAALAGPSTLLAVDASIVRVDVQKRRVVTGQPPLLTFLPVTAAALTDRRLAPIADYGSHTMYEVPAPQAQRLVDDLAREQYTAEIATDLDEVRFQEYRIDPDSGAVTPDPGAETALPAGSDGLFIIALRAYPLQAWLESLERGDVRLIQELEPAGYLVRAARDAGAKLRESFHFVRGVFPLRPAMKKVGYHPSTTPAALRPMAIRTVEETTAENLSDELAALSNDVVRRDAHGRRVTYTASISELDADVLAHFANVWSVGPFGEVDVSAERQGVLVFQTPDPASGTLNLPSTSPDYFGQPSSLLNLRGITDFSNTRVAVIDTGFHVGTNVSSDFQNANGSSTIQFCGATGICTERGSGAADERLHGTVVASIIGAFTDLAQRPGARDAQLYRYSLGLAPRVSLVIDKIIDCTPGSAVPNSAFGTIRPFGPNVVNMSFNEGGTPGCVYTQNSLDVDNSTRDDEWLFTISAGNLPEGRDPPPFETHCDTVRAPGTAKNGITVGATNGLFIRSNDPPYEDDALQWTNHVPAEHSPPRYAGICNWNGPNPPSAYRDARHIPSYSVARDPLSLVKPDLVAPGTRITGPIAGVGQPPVCSFGDPGCRCTQFGIFCNDALALDGSVGAWYGFSAGTSFSAPAVAGAAAVVRRWHVNVAGANPSPAMTKAMLINGALDLGPRTGIPAASRLDENTMTPIGSIGNIPDPYQGWGMLNLTRLLGPYQNYYFYDQRSPLLSGEGAWQKYLYIRDGARETRVTLVWTDAPSTVGSIPYRAVNNLNLSFTRVAAGITWYGNKLTNGYSNTSSSKLDKYNNVEQVILPKDLFTTGEGVLVVVDPYSVMETEGQDFALFVDNASEPATKLYTVPPCRVVDTRWPFGTFGAPELAANLPRVFPLANQCGIPATARAVAVNVTVFGATTAGKLRLYPAGIAPPDAATIYYPVGQVRANNAILALAPGGGLAAYPDQPSGTVHLVIDVRGYYQ